jgi:hypothetical protein
LTALLPRGARVTGMPIGPPSQVPEPKSACTRTDAPMLETYAAERAPAGSLSIRARQMLSAGATGQPEGPAAAGEAGGVEDARGAGDVEAGEEVGEEVEGDTGAVARARGVGMGVGVAGNVVADVAMVAAGSAPFDAVVGLEAEQATDKSTTAAADAATAMRTMRRSITGLTS